MGSQGGNGSMMGFRAGGMISRTALQGLKGASGPRFDHMYLTMMLRHHASMIAIAKAESTGGVDPAAMRLARRMLETQTGEMSRLRRLLRR